jgi:hypothetical protein
MAGDVHMRGTDLGPCCQVGKGQWHFDVVRHEAEHPFVEAARGMAQQAAQVGEAPAVIERRANHVPNGKAN